MVRNFIHDQQDNLFHNRKIAFLLCLVVVSFVPGCWRGRAKPEGMPPLHPCVLTFVQEGVAVDNAIVILRSNDSDFQWSVGGATDASGNAVIRTNGFFTGVPTGQYRVLVRKEIREGPPLPEKNELPDNEDEQRKLFEKINRQTKHFSVIDDRFKSAETTTLEFEVVKGKNQQTFELGKAVRDEIRFTN